MPHFKPVTVAALVLSALVLSTSPAHGLGLGRPTSKAVLGDTLQVTVPLRVEAGESVTADCVSAEVFFGEDKVSPAAVSVSLMPAPLGGEPSLLVRTTVLINEPVVTVRLSAGCQARITRQFVALADPPGREASLAADVPPPVARSLFAEAAEATAEPPPHRARSEPRRSASSQQVVRRAPRAALPAARPRLQLDPVDADAVVQPDLRWSADIAAAGLSAARADADPQVQARREAAGALWRALNATPEQMLADQKRVQELEQRLLRLQQASDATRETVSGLQARVRQIESRSLDADGAAWPWALALTGAGGLAYAWGRRAGRRGAAQGASPWPAAAEDMGIPPQPPEESADHPADPDPGRAVSVEELIDLEQQAEFFVVLGQDEAAIELLEAHVFGDAMAIPWPHLKLLEIHQRRGSRAEYERVRTEFQRHFNASAPEWESDLEQGRHLIDHPGVIERLQALWPTPSQAMEMLEKSLLRSRTGDETFDLPAYRELLFLYAVARDLADRGGSGSAPR